AKPARSRVPARPGSTTRTCACSRATFPSAARSCRAASPPCRPRSSVNWPAPSSAPASSASCPTPSSRTGPGTSLGSRNGPRLLTVPQRTGQPQGIIEMKVILVERIGRTGTIGDDVNVKDGFARNFLLPQGKALRATEANRKRFEAERAHIEKRNEERRAAAAGIAEGLDGTSVVIIRQAGETGQLYGSVAARDV